METLHDDFKKYSFGGGNDHYFDGRLHGICNLWSDLPWNSILLLSWRNRFCCLEESLDYYDEEFNFKLIDGEARYSLRTHFG